MKVRKVKILSGPYGGLYGYVKYYDSFIRTITTVYLTDKSREIMADFNKIHYQNYNTCDPSIYCNNLLFVKECIIKNE